ncbi:hypothetical protein NDU88_008324, partial [Pleurodeles waltl]
ASHISEQISPLEAGLSHLRADLTSGSSPLTSQSRSHLWKQASHISEQISPLEAGLSHRRADLTSGSSPHLSQQISPLEA